MNNIPMSQSLRKSGLFRRLAIVVTILPVGSRCRNPFVNQVFSVSNMGIISDLKPWGSRNPFVNQVFSVGAEHARN